MAIRGPAGTLVTGPRFPGPRPVATLSQLLKMCQALWAIEFITITIFYSLFCHVIPSILLLPLYLISPKIWYSIERKLYSWSAFGLAIFTKRSGTKISVYGEVEKLRTALRGSSDDMFVVMSNHQTPVDVSVLSMFWQAIGEGVC